MQNTIRRIKQLGFLLSDPALQDHRAIERRIKERYESDAEVRHYVSIVNEGLDREEAQVVSAFVDRAGRPNRALVIGCGAGREAIALAKRGFAVTAIDISDRMISSARELTAPLDIGISFEVADVRSFAGDRERFDFIFVSAAIAEHIPSRNERIRFYRSIRRLMTDAGGVHLSPSILSARTPRMQVWSAVALRLRWRLSGVGWENGDGARAFFGRHNLDLRPVFYHYYPSFLHLAEELQASDLEIETEFSGAYLLKARVSR